MTFGTCREPLENQDWSCRFVCLAPGARRADKSQSNSTSSPNRWAWIGTRSASVMRSTGGNARLKPGAQDYWRNQDMQPIEAACGGKCDTVRAPLDQHAS